MLFISTNHKEVQEILPQDLAENFTLSILITGVVSEPSVSFVSTGQTQNLFITRNKRLVKPCGARGKRSSEGNK